MAIARTFVKWLEMELSSSVTKRLAISGWPILYDGNTYDNNGVFVSSGDIKYALDLENTPFEVTLSLNDADVLNSINDLTYRYRKATLRLGQYCLLYTSPSPRDRTRSRMPSSA